VADLIEARVRQNVPVREEFVSIPFPRLAAADDRQVVAAIESYKREAAVVDARLAREVTCAFKAAALADVCSQIRSDTGIQLAAGSSVADEKVTLFCKATPLREVMRQLSRPFGYTWIRSSTPNAQRLTPDGSEPGVRRLPRAADDEPLSARRAGSPSGVAFALSSPAAIFCRAAASWSGATS
jgi:hypothetical protein